jgi:hypothetical protein
MPSTQGYLDRYLAGEHVAVWSELVALGDKVREEPLRAEAVRVCEVIVRHARFNLRTLHARLLEMGYQFADPDAALVDAGPDATAKIEEIEQELGALPLIARAWYGILGSLNFCQDDQQGVYKGAGRPPMGPDIFGLGSHPVLIVQSLDSCREQLQDMAEYPDEVPRPWKWKEIGREAPDESVKYSGFLPLGGWASNCEPKGFMLPCHGVDGVIYNDGGGDTYFVDQLRWAFQWGGFPFWKRSLVDAHFYSPCEYRPNFAKLLPILKEGLLEL